MVIKPNVSIRISADFKVSINEFIQDQPFRIPRFEEILNIPYDQTLHSIIDIKEVHLQMKESESLRHYLIISTQKGFFRYKRIPFSIASAPSISKDVWTVY
ncbi:hypothetical protein RF11_11745 [Thelohanellus kitauei]|uniref:Uncharacterized protein n=1 Tax=Thelohanellus kitauei TaxID=669202 RepID=A0A0C2JPE7_THEKT|nr:hypothetical protein RF11_11745 [Thelohanellus kitauei]